jgi:phage tail sheath gpL-like
MTISFNTIPSALRVPLAYVEFDNSRAVVGTPAIPFKLLVMGQKLSTGIATENVPVQITSYDAAELQFGRGSQLAEMFRALKANDKFTPTWALPQVDNAAGVAATGTLTFAGTPTEAGVVYCYVAGTRLTAAVASADTVTVIAAAVAAAINADTSLPVTAAAAVGVVTCTARNKGECGNGIDLRLNYYTGERLPAGLTCTIVAMASGATNPVLTNAIAAMGDEWYQGVVCPYTDAANLTMLEAEMLDRTSGTRMIDGIVFTAFRGNYAATQTFGDGRNSPHVSAIGTNTAPQPPYVWAAAYAAQAAASLSIDPARPLQTLVMSGILPPALTAQWTQAERNLLLYDGIATHYVDSGGLVRIEREVTMYQENAFGVADPSYLDITTLATLSYMRYSVRARITQKFPRHKLADDGTNFGPGQAIVTPKTIRAELIALASEWETAGLLENLDQFKDELIVERNANDRNRVDVLAPPDLVNQLRIFAAQVQFIL